MRLYHDSNIVISDSDLNKCRPYKDFGKAFYLTEIRDQVEKMASRVARIYGGELCVIVYEFDEAALTDGDIIAFLVEERQIDIAEAMKAFYNSETYEKLLDEETGLYLKGAQKRALLYCKHLFRHNRMI